MNEADAKPRPPEWARPPIRLVRRNRYRLARVAGWAIDAVGTAVFERRFGLDTKARITLGELGAGGDGRLGYQPSAWFSLRRFLPVSEVGPDDVFLDVGSGKGRMLLIAAFRYPVKRVVGIEVAPALAAIAHANVERARAQLRCQDVTVVVADVASAPLPDDVTIVYLFNSVVGPAFERFIEQVFSSLDRAPRRLRLVYRNPTQAQILEGHGRARLVRSTARAVSSRGQRDGIALYEILPAGAAPPASSPRRDSRVTEASRLEGELCRIWADVLGLQEVDPHAAFFELGGDSLAAETVFEEIAAQLGQEHSSMLLLECRTPAELARRLAQPIQEEPLLAIQPNGTRPPLFIIHDLVGDVFYARQLSEHLGPEQPVFALTPPLGEGGHAMLAGRLEDLTRRYVDAVTRLWPHGPYRLYGYSLGGVLAFQMAVELQARGATVDLLALGDSAAPSILPEDIATIDPDVLLFGAERAPMMERLRRGVIAWSRALRDAGPRGVAPLLLHAARAQASYLRWRVSRTGRARARFTRTFRASVRYPLTHRLAVLSREYEPATRFAGSALLIRTRENMDAWGMAPAADRGWSAHVEGTVTTVTVPCLHDDLGREPYLGMLARILQPPLAADGR